MLNHKWRIFAVITIWLLICCHHLFINAQSQNAIGAHRVYQKTSFSCVGRPAGYYADIETGCQVYHMCDGLGRQFSYSCPNTTLFQQRMLICDHWYMVNCSKAESNYAANLLIGQRDKPFVNDEENSLRTPRPDLLDRPYAPDYSGESFRNQYKQLPAIQNQIFDNDAEKKNYEKTALASQASPQQLAPGQQHWHIPPPSRTILPPSYETQSQDNDGEVLGGRTQQQYNFGRDTNVHSVPTTTTTTATTISRRNHLNSAALHQRQHNADTDDLGTSHSTRYNTSSDYNSSESAPRKVSNRKTTTTKATPITTRSATTNSVPTKIAIKVPSKIYEPPFLYPIYNMDDDASSTETPLIVSTATPFTVATSSSTSSSTPTTTTRSPSRPTTFAGKPFTSGTDFTTPTTISIAGRNQNNIIQSTDYNRNDARAPTPAHGFKAPTTPTPGVTQPHNNVDGQAAVPANDLLPPYEEFIVHDIATTQGPPIYYEWKVPSNGLEPPKLEPPIGEDGREYPDAVIDYNSISAADGLHTPTSFGIDQENSSSSVRNSFVKDPFQATAKGGSTNDDAAASRTPISRSIKDTAQPNNRNSVASRTTGRPSVSTAQPPSASSSTTPADITQIRKELSVPDYSFPLENLGRTGYLDTDTYNSFQLKIPEHRNDDKHDNQHWFGENPKCPECHPSHVVPGTCEPCVRR